MELDNIILSEVSRLRGPKLHVLPHMWIIDPPKCSNVIGHGTDTNGKLCMGGIGKGKKT
jgi:hypothetical protein